MNEKNRTQILLVVHQYVSKIEARLHVDVEQAEVTADDEKKKKNTTTLKLHAGIIKRKHTWLKLLKTFPRDIYIRLINIELVDYFSPTIRMMVDIIVEKEEGKYEKISVENREFMEGIMKEYEQKIGKKVEQGG
jgi:hypothetical protein